MPLKSLDIRKRKKASMKGADRAVVAANRFVLRHYPLGLLCGVPRRLQLQDSDVWIVPVFLTSSGYGAIGEVGVVAVDAITGAIVGSTPRSEVVATGKRLREENHDAIEAAFLQARKA